MTPRSRWLTFRLATADLLHEWLLTLCLVMAVAAVMGPLLLLFGLKHGTIETLRHRLVQDPRNREIRPMVSKSFAREWFEEIGKRPDVAFLIPATRQVAASVEAAVWGTQGSAPPKKLQLDVIPTGEEDPLVLENGAPVPGKGQCVLSAPAAEALGAGPGDRVKIWAKRLKGSGFEAGELLLEVAGVLDLRASGLKWLFVRLELLEAVEQFKDGRAVAQYGWPGAVPLAYPVYDGAVLVLGKELDALEEFRLLNGTGFTGVQRLSAAELTERTERPVAEKEQGYFLYCKGRPVGEESVEAVRRRLRGIEHRLIPWVGGMKAEIRDEGGKTISQLELQALPAVAGNGAIEPGSRRQSAQAQPSEAWREVALPAAAGRPAGKTTLCVKGEAEPVCFPVMVLEEIAPGTKGRIPLRLAAVLNLGREREIGFDPVQGEFVLSRRGYASFRLYAATIDDVARLGRDMEAQGIPVHTEAQRIRDVLQLDRYLTLIFSLVAAVGVAGGVAALMASLYASVQRKQKELSVLRLVGFSVARLVRFPVYQGVLVGSGGFAVAMGFFLTLAWVIDTLFRDHLKAAESLCRLAAGHVGAAYAATVVISIAAASVAAWRTTRIDPAEALRDE